MVPLLAISLVWRPIVVAPLLAAFIVADIWDGVVARKYGSDGPRRRAVDSLVDRIAIHSVLMTCVALGLLPVMLYAILVVRDLYCGRICFRMFRDLGTVVKADGRYRGLNLLIAAWVISAPRLGHDVRAATFGVVLVVAVGVAWDLRRCVFSATVLDPRRDSVREPSALRLLSAGVRT
jgi:phosphatidylglycerophosphate synthase